MQKIRNYQILIIIAVITFAVVGLPMLVGAQEKNMGDNMPVSNTSDIVTDSNREERLREFQEKRDAERQKIELRREEVKTKLESKKLEVCKKHEQSINNLMGRISDRGNKRLKLLNESVERVKSFYTEKSLSVENYESLLAAIDSARAVAEASVNNTTESSVTFKCDGTDPRGASEYFKQDMKGQVQALKDYRSTVKDLIKAVKTTYEALEASNTQEDQ